NTYQPYSGPREPCVSPYLAELDALTGRGGGTPQGTDMVSFEEVDAEVAMEFTPVEREGEFRPARMTRDHTQSCFDRYRSSRPADNRYQPADGGPRRQCM